MALAKADVIFENGIGFETWLDKLYNASQSKAQRVVVSKGLKLLDADDEHDHEKKRPATSISTTTTTTIRTSGTTSRNAIQIVGVIRDELMKLDAVNSDKYKVNAAAYLGGSRTSTSGL